ncbi:MAG: Fic family protein [Bdellovibrionaceae bacterium]|nr:Fic family protein [Pseudobdellovibrionaceae bacterium]
MKADFKDRVGTWQVVKSGEETYKSYVPKPLPPKPEIDLSRLYPLIDKAVIAIGRLDGMSRILPDASLFIYMYVRKEALLSSQIEGTQSSLSDLLMYENAAAPGAPMDDVVEVSNYVSAMNYGLTRLKEFPLSLRIIREIHAELMRKGRGNLKQPGEFRTSQNWIGGSRPGNALFVPPPVGELMRVLGEFESFLHDPKVKMPVLVKAALAHVQFETIHPFLDGNGRLGRLLITFMLCMEGVLSEPLLYLSLYFKTHRERYYELLQSVRVTGNWEEWIEFFLVGVEETASQATETAHKVLTVFKNDRRKLEEASVSAGILSVFEVLQRRPICNTSIVREETGLSLPTVLRAFEILIQLGIVREITGKDRHKTFVYHDYLNILSQGTEPIKRSPTS